MTACLNRIITTCTLLKYAMNVAKARPGLIHKIRRLRKRGSSVINELFRQINDASALVLRRSARLSKIRTPLYIVPLMALLSACSGGISGTGDGSPIITPGEENSAGGIDSGDNSADNLDSQLHSPVQLPINGLNTALTNLSIPLSRQARLAAQDTITVLLETRFDAYTTAANQVYGDLRALQNTLTDKISQCDNSGQCDAIPAVISVEFNGATLVFNSIQYSQALPGTFDNSLSYTRENGDFIRVLWTGDGSLISLYTDTNTHTTYALEDSLQSSLTFRQWSKSGQTLTQSNIVTDANNVRTIEADVLDWYVRARVTEQFDVLYAASSTDNTIRREAVSTENDLILSESCDSMNCVWQPDHATDSGIFVGSELTAGNFSQPSNTSIPGISIPEAIQRLVIAQTPNRVTPPTDSLVCGATTVQNTRRFFCWTPLPLSEHNNVIFEEQFSGGNAEYLFVPTQ